MLQDQLKMQLIGTLSSTYQAIKCSLFPLLCFLEPEKGSFPPQQLCMNAPVISRVCTLSNIVKDSSVSL